MDEEDSQDELVIKSTSHGKGKRPVSSIFTDEEDDTDEGGDNLEESDDSGEDDEDDEEEVDDSDDGEEDAGKGLEGAVGGTSADLSSDEDAEKCPICLHSFQEQPVATPEGCEHYFCLDCILEWSKNANSCPVDRIAFSHIHLRKCYGGKVTKTITVQKPVKAEEEVVDVDFDQTCCEVCGRSDREDRLLLCDGCDAGYHMECLTPPLDAVPVEEWFCPECAANNPHAGQGGEEVSEDEVAALVADAVPTTSRLRTSTTGLTRSIARTRQSERVRANVNRNRITQHVPRYLIQSTWLDETINAVLNSAVHVRNVTSRAGTSRKRKAGKVGKQRKSKSKKLRARSSSATSRKDRTAGEGMGSHRQRLRRAKKQAVKKDPAPYSGFSKSVGGGKQKRRSSNTSMYHPEIGPSSLSIYGDPFDLDPFEDDDREAEQASGPFSPPNVNRRGLSHSALRSHQPVARPIQVGLSRRGLHIPEADVVEETSPVPDLLGSILSGQSMLLMDSSDVVINRDGSLKPMKPACKSSSRTSISSSSSVYELTTQIHVGVSTSSGSMADHGSRDAGPSHNFPNGLSSPHSPPSTSLSPAAPVHPQPAPHMSSIELGGSHVSPVNSGVQRPSVNRMGLNQRGWNTHGPSNGPTPLRHTDSGSDSSSRGKERGSVKKAPPKPVWQDVSGLPRIPKIRKESFPGGSSKGSDGISDSCVNSMMGNGSLWQTMNPGTSGGEQGRTGGGERQRQDRAGTQSAFSSSSSTSTSLPANPSSSSTVSFHTSASGNTWHAKRHSSPGALCNPLPATADKTLEKNLECKKVPASSKLERKYELTKGEIYDPFDPTVSDSNASDSASESEAADTGVDAVMSREKEPPASSLEFNQENVSHQAKPETPEGDSEERDKHSGSSQDTKNEKEVTEADGCLNLGDETQNPCKPEELSNEPLPQEGQATSASHRTDTTNADEQSNRITQKDSSHWRDRNIKSEDKSKPEDRSCRSASHSAAKRKEDQREREKMNDGHSSSSCPGTSGRQREIEGKSSKTMLHCSQSGERKRTQSPSELTEASGRSRGKRRQSQSRSRSRSRDRRRSRSRSRDGSKGGKLKEKSREQHNSKGSESWKGSKEKRQGYSRSRSRSRSRERRRDRKWSQSTSRSRDRHRSRSKDRKKLRSRSRSREKGENFPSCSRDAIERNSPKRKGPSATSHKESTGPKETKEQKLVSATLVKEVTEHKEVVEDKAVSLHLVKEVTEPMEFEDKPVSPSTFREVREPGEYKKEEPVSLNAVNKITEQKEIKINASPTAVQEVKKPKEFIKEKPFSPSKETGEHGEVKKDKPVTSSTVKEGTEHKEIEVKKHVSPTVGEEGKEPEEFIKDKSVSSSEVKKVTEHKPVSPGIPKEVADPKEKKKDRHVASDVDRKVTEPKKMKKDKHAAATTVKELTDLKEIKKEKNVCPDVAKVTNHEDIKEDKPVCSSAVKEITAHKEIKIKTHVSPGMFKDITEARDIKKDKTVYSSAINEVTEPKELKNKRVSPSMVKEFTHPREVKSVKNVSPTVVKEVTEPKEIKAKKHISLSVAEEGNNSKKMKTEKTLLSAVKEEVSTATAHGGEEKNGEEPEKDKKRTDTKLDLKTHLIKMEEPAQVSCQDKALSSEKTKTSPATLYTGTEESFKVGTASVSSNNVLLMEREKIESTEPEEKDPVNQEREISSPKPSEISVGSVPDSLDVRKPDETTGAGGDEGKAGVQDTPVVMEEGRREVTPKTNLVTVTACAKSKPAVKRVTWSLQEKDEAPTDKPRKLCTLKQRGMGGSTPAISSQALTQPAALLSEHADRTERGDLGSVPLSSGCEADLELGMSAASTGQGTQDSSEKDKYMKKLHIQRRAVEEVKVAIKPFYQRRDITKEEYKEILRKAVQKICHSRSGEINTVKVANLVKAYVDKYKHARKHRNTGEEGRLQEAGRDPVMPQTTQTC
ncbi:hypothetical protein MATL_G00142910 [Megalops atlanticus]|uniref:PHD and RING finger domain-containing protein 1 n=1 Tax=Megalops atlanticus TaxID=7932 RepID=A0A9D3PTV3_MEGAT|nr:hypothetical protein MATL_G00142910 [Megalops atlanticus]